MGDCKSEASKVNTLMETQGLTNKILNLQGYSDTPIIYQQSKDWPHQQHLLISLTHGKPGRIIILWKTIGRPPSPVDSDK